MISKHSTIPVPDSLKAPKKLVLPSIFDTHKSFILDDVKLAELTTTVLNERMWHFREGVKRYSDPSYIFWGGQDPTNPQDPGPCVLSRVESSPAGAAAVAWLQLEWDLHSANLCSNPSLSLVSRFIFIFLLISTTQYTVHINEWQAGHAARSQSDTHSRSRPELSVYGFYPAPVWKSLALKTLVSAVD